MSRNNICALGSVLKTGSCLLVEPVKPWIPNFWFWTALKSGFELNLKPVRLIKTGEPVQYQNRVFKKLK